MAILKTAIDCPKAKLFSTYFFYFFAILVLIASIGFWQLGKPNLEKAYIIPTLALG